MATTPLHFAERMSRLGTESAFDVMVRARALEAQGRDIIHLQLGEPDFDTPAHIIEAGIEALRNGETHYTPPAGIPQLREAIANEVSQTRGVTIEPDQVVVTPGGKPIMFYLILALAGPGDEVIYPDTGFPIYGSVVNFSGATPMPLALREENDFRFDLDELRALISDRTRLVIINSPANPTGGVLTDEEISELARLAVKHDFVVMSDEIYRKIVYGDFEQPSIISYPGMQERTVILDGFSKTYAMTGWRLGFGVMPRDLALQVTRLAINCNSCTPGFTQLAGVAALTGPQEPVEQMVAEFQRRRDAIVAGLNDIPGVTCNLPLGAFYVFPNVSHYGDNIADYLLNEAGVAMVDGTSFGAQGKGYLRISYANSLENIEKALERMREALLKM
ncbi:MAG: pyridoxal phosphate-dependent aminotransferase [Chloroflexia bacterium]|nr:pyridoxal phosphate-dependent aminotransferase [Chloroflexia bacterium]